jgi:hypothetical protein
MQRRSFAVLPDRRSLAVVLVATLVALAVPVFLAVASSAFAQEPEPPTGEPQEPPPSEPEEPAPEPPTTTVPDTGGEAPGPAGETLPRTGWEALLYFALGAGLLLAGARLRVLTRIREVGHRVSARLRRRPTDVALREALEPIRAARLSPPSPDPDPGPLHVEPSTPTARRLTGVAERD